MNINHYHLIKAGAFLRTEILSLFDDLSDSLKSNVIKSLTELNLPINDESVLFYFEEEKKQKNVKNYIKNVTKDLPTRKCKRLDYERFHYPHFIRIEELAFFQENDVLNTLGNSPRRLMSSFFNVGKYKEAFYIFDKNKEDFEPLDLLKIILIKCEKDNRALNSSLLLSALEDRQKQELVEYLSNLSTPDFYDAFKGIYNSDHDKYIHACAFIRKYENLLKSLISEKEKIQINASVKEKLAIENQSRRRL